MSLAGRAGFQKVLVFGGSRRVAGAGFFDVDDRLERQARKDGAAVAMGSWKEPVPRVRIHGRGGQLEGK